MKAFVLRL